MQNKLQELDQRKADMEKILEENAKMLQTKLMAEMTKHSEEDLANLEVKFGDLDQWWDRQNELIYDLSNRRTIIADRFTNRAETHGDLKSETKDYLNCIPKPDVDKLKTFQQNDLEAITKELDEAKRTIEKQKQELTAYLQGQKEGLQQ